MIIEARDIYLSANQFGIDFIGHVFDELPLSIMRQFGPIEHLFELFMIYHVFVKAIFGFFNLPLSLFILGSFTWNLTHQNFILLFFQLFIDFLILLIYEYLSGLNLIFLKLFSNELRSKIPHTFKAGLSILFKVTGHQCHFILYVSDILCSSCAYSSLLLLERTAILWLFFFFHLYWMEIKI